MQDKERAKTVPPSRGTTQSPADRDIFGDNGAETPVKDRAPDAAESQDSSEAGGVD